MNAAAAVVYLCIRMSMMRMCRVDRVCEQAERMCAVFYGGRTRARSTHAVMKLKMRSMIASGVNTHINIIAAPLAGDRMRGGATRGCACVCALCELCVRLNVCVYV